MALSHRIGFIAIGLALMGSGSLVLYEWFSGAAGAVAWNFPRFGPFAILIGLFMIIVVVTQPK